VDKCFCDRIIGYDDKTLLPLVDLTEDHKAYLYNKSITPTTETYQFEDNENSKLREEVDSNSVNNNQKRGTGRTFAVRIESGMTAENRK
jgi:hypothetical protein